MSTTAIAADARRLPLELIDAAANVRELDLAHVEALAGSIALRGLIVPLVVRPQGDGRYTLVAGFHRYAACQRAGLEQLPVVVRDDDGESADRAAENVVRKQLSPLEEARAVKAMLDQGYTLDGAASVLGWARQRVSARAKLLELPEQAQQLVGAGSVPVSGVDAFLAIAAVSRPLCELVAAAIAEAEQQGNELGVAFARDPGHVVEQALSYQRRDRRRGGLWAAYLTDGYGSEFDELKLGKKSDQLLEEAERLNRKLNPYGYGPPRIEFAERARRVNLELGRALLTELATVDPDDMRVARFFAYGLLAPASSGYLGTADHAARTIAANGLRLVLEEHRSSETQTRKDGTPGRTKVSYAEPEQALAWLWKFVAAAKAAGELYGRVLVVFAAQHYALQIALPQSQRRPSVLPSSHKDQARTALEKIAKPVLPAGYRELVRAIEREARGYEKRRLELHSAAREAAAPDSPGEPARDDDDELADVDQLDGEDLDGKDLEDELEAA